MGVRDEIFSNYFVFIKKDQDLDNKFRLVTAMHRNGPLPQVEIDPINFFTINYNQLHLHLQ